jgi:hypothetical protein
MKSRLNREECLNGETEASATKAEKRRKNNKKDLNCFSNEQQLYP